MQNQIKKKKRAYVFLSLLLYEALWGSWSYEEVSVLITCRNVRCRALSFYRLKMFLVTVTTWFLIYQMSSLRVEVAASTQVRSKHWGTVTCLNRQHCKIPSLTFLLFAILSNEIKKKANPQTFVYMNRHASRSTRIMHMTLHTWNMGPMSRKEAKLGRGKQKTHHICLIFGMIFMMALKAGFNEK